MAEAKTVEQLDEEMKAFKPHEIEDRAVVLRRAAERLRKIMRELEEQANNLVSEALDLEAVAQLRHDKAVRSTAAAAAKGLDAL